MFLDWFTQRTAGGLNGRGLGEPPVEVSAWEAFGVFAVVLAAAAALPLASAFVPAAAERLRGGLALAGGVVGLGFVLIGSVALQVHLPACCDQIYVVSVPRPGLYMGLLAAAVAATGGAIRASRAG